MARKKKDKAKHKHHRKCKANGGRNHPHNLSLVTKHEHRAWHLLFGTHEAIEIARIINTVWLDTEWQLTAIKRRYE